MNGEDKVVEWWAKKCVMESGIRCVGGGKMAGEKEGPFWSFWLGKQQPAQI